MMGVSEALTAKASMYLWGPCHVWEPTPFSKIAAIDEAILGYLFEARPSGGTVG